jgi:hypothetical protein
MATTDTSAPSVDGWHMPLYLVHVAQAHNAPRSLDLILDTTVPTKLITTQTRSVPGRIGGFFSSPVSTAMSPHYPPTTSRKQTFQLRSEPQRTRALPVATQSSSLLTKSYGLATNSTARSLIHTKFVPTETVFAMTHGTPIDPWDRSQQHIHTVSRVRTEQPFRIARSDGLGDGDPPAHRNYGSSLEPSGSAHVETALRIDKCRRLYINRVAGYMVGLAAHLFAISPPLACRYVSLLYVLGQILVHDAPTGTTWAGRAGIGAAFTSERHLSVTFENLLKSPMEHRS